MHRIVVAPEPYDFRPLYQWRVFGPQLVHAGIALTEGGAWAQADAVMQGASTAVTSRPVDGRVAGPDSGLRAG